MIPGAFKMIYSWASLGGGQGDMTFGSGGQNILCFPHFLGKNDVFQYFLLDLYQVIRLILLSKHLLAITYVSLCSILCNIFQDRQFYNDSMGIMPSTCKFQCIFQKNIQCTWWCITLNNVFRQPQ